MPRKLKAHWPLGKGAGICIHDNVLPHKLCKSIIRFFEERPYLQFEGQTFGGVQPDVKLTMDSIISGNPEHIQDPEDRATVANFDKSIYEQYTVALSDYISQYDSLTREWLNREDTGYQYQRYAKGVGFYKPHIDGSPYSGRGAEERVLASVMYLNTVRRGGGTHFDYFDFTCDAVEGRVVTFPATFLHLHGGVMPESSDKSIISTFVSAPRSPVDLTGINPEPTPEVVDTGATLPTSEFD